MADDDVVEGIKDFLEGIARAIIVHGIFRAFNKKRGNPKPGDHVYARRTVGSFSHHGIYVDERSIIHFTRTNSNDKENSRAAPCRHCGHQSDRNHGVVKTCFECFLKEGNPRVKRSLRLYDYGSQSCKPSGEVVEIATRLIESGFGDYHSETNNCEHFATFCKTGFKNSAYRCCYKS